jgi:putative transposase
VSDDVGHETNVFHYIHQNPVKAGLVKKMEEWEFSSFRDYLGLRDETLCNTKLTQERLAINFNRLLIESYEVIDFHLED